MGYSVDEYLSFISEGRYDKISNHAIDEIASELIRERDKRTFIPVPAKDDVFVNKWCLPILATTAVLSALSIGLYIIKNFVL